jgi:hypothetical protein
MAAAVSRREALRQAATCLVGAQVAGSAVLSSSPAGAETATAAAPAAQLQAGVGA